MRILVTGASGLVGSRLVVRLRERHEVHGTYHRHRPEFLGLEGRRLHLQDIRAWRGLVRLVRDLDPSVVVHCAAMTDVDGCESAPDEAVAANVAPAQALAREAKWKGFRLLLLSTDYVFDGTAPPYETNARPHPLCAYARTKAQAELALRGVRQSLIVRSGVIYGATFGDQKRNFAMWLIGELRAGRGVKVVDDQWNAPTLSEQVAEVVERAVDRGAIGVIHAAANECVSRYDFARRVAARFGLDASLITPVPTAALKQPARRPRRACLAVARTQEALGMQMWSIERSLDLLHRQLSLPDRSTLSPWW